MRLHFEKLLKKKDQWVILLLLGILLAVAAVPMGDGGGEKTGETAAARSGDAQEPQADEAERLEERLEAALSQVEGVGKTKVMVTVESTGEKFVEKDSQTSGRDSSDSGSDGGQSVTQESDVSESTVYTKTKDGEEIPYVAKETAVKIRGVLVVAQGGGSPVIAQNITDAVMALFGVEAHKIKVMKMS